MPTRSHPASVTALDDALGTPGALNASKKVAAAEELFDAIDFTRLAGSGRPDRLKTCLKRRLAVIAALASQRPADEFDRWINTYWAQRTRRRNHRKPNQ